MDNILALHYDLLYHNYRHAGYRAFKISDPKPRQIHKASVRDRLLHRAIYRILYPFFDRTFISASYSCRLTKGTHKAIKQFQKSFYKVSYNNTRTCYALKGDIKKFFASIDHYILINILKEYILDDNVIDLLEKVINSFHAGQGNKGLPLGNLTSQLLVNVYMNELDQSVTRKLKIKYYIRYADDFVILSDSKQRLIEQTKLIKRFLVDELKLELHPQKIFLKTIYSGLDFLGWVNFPDHRVLRSSTKRRMFRKLKENSNPESLNSYLGLLSHGNAKKLRLRVIKDSFIEMLS